jgi:4-nitrophenyl phosphatase
MEPRLSETNVRERLKNIKAFVIDQDGTTYLENQTFSWTRDFLNGLDQKGIRYLFLSNNSSKSRNEHCKKLISSGVNVTEEQILSSSDATIEYLKTQPGHKDIYLLATPSVENDYKNEGFNIDAEQPNYVVLAYDLTLTFDKLDKACQLVRNGVTFLATHEDNNWMIGPNQHRPDVGALAAAITTSTKVKPKFIGKPNAEMVDAFLARLQLSKDQIAIIGDRMNTDIRMGQEHDILSFLVLSGKTKAEDVAASPFQPDFVVDKTIDILDFLEN